MKLEFSYKWYLQQCKKNDLNPEHELAQFHLEQAKKQSRKMKYFMDALKRYKDYEEAVPKIKRQIDRHNQRRMASMLDALDAADGKGLEK